MSPANNRLRIFIDGGYFFKVFSPYRELGYRYSSKRLIRRLAESYNLVKVHYVSSINMRDKAVREKQEKFYYGQLRDELGWEVDILALQWPGGKATQKGVDATLAVKFHHLAVKDEYDTAILIAADSDFCGTVNLVKEQGKIVRNAFFLMRPSYHLTQACNGPQIILDTIDFIYHGSDHTKLFTLAEIKKPPKSSTTLPP